MKVENTNPNLTGGSINAQIRKFRLGAHLLGKKIL